MSIRAALLRLLTPSTAEPKTLPPDAQALKAAQAGLAEAARKFSSTARRVADEADAFGDMVDEMRGPRQKQKPRKPRSRK